LIILYFSDSKFPLAVLAGEIHTGHISGREKIDHSVMWDIINLKKEAAGKILFLGSDERDNKIYAVPVKGWCAMLPRLVNSFLDIHKIPRDKLKLVNCGVTDNILLSAGRLLLRHNLPAPLGRFLIIYGIKKNYVLISRLVSGIKARLTLPEG